MNTADLVKRPMADLCCDCDALCSLATSIHLNSL
jgi:hypothetical protein